MNRRQQRSYHIAFLRRHSMYERRYANRMLAILARQYREAADAYPSQYQVNADDYRRWYELLYTTILPSEAAQAFDDFVVPLVGGDKINKDFFDDVAAMLGFEVPRGEFIRIWRDISQEWLNINILTRIREVAATTQRAIAKIIERNINEGRSITETAAAIRSEATGEINRNRSMMIARTETISAMNKGKRLSMMTSNLLWDKKWLDTPDKRTRMSHAAIAREDYRPIEQPYWLVTAAGTLEPLDYPGDPNGSPENVINCRCTEIYEVQRDSSGRPIRRRQSPVIDSAELLEVIA